MPEGRGAPLLAEAYIGVQGTMVSSPFTSLLFISYLQSLGKIWPKAPFTTVQNKQLLLSALQIPILFTSFQFTSVPDCLLCLAHFLSVLHNHP